MADSDNKLDQLQRKIDEAKSHADDGKQASPDDSAPRMDAMRLGLELVAGVGVGSVAGYFIDHWLHTMPLFFIVCFFLGATAGFRNMIRESRNMDKGTKG